MYDKNETAYREKVELNQLNYSKINPHEDYLMTEDYVKVHSKYLRQKLMIVGEGSVFIVLLLFGLMWVRSVFLKEMKLAEQQKNFLLSITHELKSPISTVKLSLQTLFKRKLEPEKSEKLIVNSLVDLDRLETLVDNILFAAKIERDEAGFSSEDLNASEFVLQAIERFAHNARGIDIKSEVIPNVYLKADPMGFTSVINNLIENAVKSSETGTDVNVTLRDNESHVELTISDTGIGIPEAEKGRIFEKFYRVGNENTRRTSGMGLGLYIVKRFVEIYNGNIEIDNNQPKGSRFIITFPKE